MKKTPSLFQHIRLFLLNSRLRELERYIASAKARVQVWDRVVINNVYVAEKICDCTSNLAKLLTEQEQVKAQIDAIYSKIQK